MASLSGFLARAWSAGVEQALPARCGVCGGVGALLCVRCARALPTAGSQRCRRCWATCLVGECPRCAEYGCECTAVRAGFSYAAGAKQLVSAVKYGGRFALAGPMSALMARSWTAYGLSIEAVAAVPLHPRRERERGFNQAEILAGGVATALGLPHLRGLATRPRATRPQARLSGEADRRANVYDAFDCRSAAAAGTRLLLIDDVTTTGATLGACASALFAAGAEAVYGFAFAIAE